MDELSRTRYSVEGGSFYSMQQNWREEIQQLFSETKNLEIELRDKEEQLKTTAMKQKMSEEIIRQKENKLKHREIELVHRELQLVLMKPTESPLKHGKSKLFGGVLTTKLSTGEQISLPTGFRNLISVKNVKPYNASQSPPTSPHGYRSELRVLVYTDDKFLNAVAGAGPFTDPQTPKKFSSRKTSSTKFGGGAGGSRRSSTFFGAKFAEAFRSLTTVLTAVPVGGRNVCEEIVYTPCGTTAVLVPPSPYITPRRQTPELCGGLDYLCRQNSRGVSNPTSAFASPAKQRSLTPRLDLCNNNNNNSNTMPALYAMNRSPVPCPSTSSGGSDSAASSTKSRSRKPLPNDKYRSYTKMQRPRSCDESQPTDAATHAAGARDVTNSNYQKQFFAPTLKNSLAPTSPLPPQRPFTLDIASGGSPRRSFAKTHPLSSRIAARGCSADSSSCSSTGAGTRTYGGAAKNNNFHSASNDSNVSAS